MARIEDQNIIGFYLGSETICRECATDSEQKSAELDNIIVEDDSDTDWVFCDRCKKRMN